MARTSASSFLLVLLVTFAVSGGSLPRGASAFSLFPDIGKCWHAVVEVEDCVVKLVPAFLSLHIKITPQCCKAVSDIEESCLPFVFSNPVFGPALSHFVSNVCGALGGSSPAPTSP
ncbi:Egg cell-secreted protein 1.4 [Apostasia shenzhenica]|uniref:Egg cell-secreted protein 1.4 n=1 Tax=Apostasia shenzhenica TaxID=1088818 RepID=A0A2H9ZWW6_9ASPA|nr:Egg cell-secreted protein 1.4 [Apostasia shenzhenica]